MKLVLEWSTGEYDDYAWHVVPFEWSSAEDLYVLIEDKKQEYDEWYSDKDSFKSFDYRRASNQQWDDYRAAVAEHQLNRPLPIVDEYGHEICVDSFLSYGKWTTDLEITTLEEWFERT